MKQNGKNNPAFTCVLRHADDKNMRVRKTDDGRQKLFYGAKQDPFCKNP